MDFHKTLVAPSILACDFSRLESAVEKINASGADWIHCDVMDGHFVDNISFGPAFTEATARHAKLPIDVHLMISKPDHYFSRFVEFSSSITSHVEADHDVSKTLAGIRDAGCLAGLAISPPTPITAIEPFLGEFDILLVMTVNPGFGGQPFIPEMLEKVRTATTWRKEEELEFHIQVDGGINPETSRLSREAGANVMVAGTSVFKAPDMAKEVAAICGS